MPLAEQIENSSLYFEPANQTWFLFTNHIGLPSVLKVGNRLAIIYDGPGGTSKSHMKRDVGLAWLELPLVPPAYPK